MDHMEVDPPNLPSDIISFQILTRLPAKSLMRFKCVCKFWCSSLFRDPVFVKAHYNMHKNQNNKATHFLYKPIQENMLFSMQFKHNDTPPAAISDVLPSQNTPITQCNSRWKYTGRSSGVNGLICLWSSDAAVPVRVLNPCTRELTTLPLSQLSHQRSSIHDTYHIGYSPLTNEFKVLYRNRTYENRCIFEIFTLDSTSKSWRVVPKPGFDEESLVRSLFESKTVCFHGAIHWVVKNMMTHRSTILAFDVGEERFREILLPQDCERCFIGTIIEVNGCVAMFDEECKMDARSKDIWILKDYQNQVWVKESIVFPDFWFKLRMPLPVGTIHTGELLLRSTFTGDVHLYDMKRKSYQKTEIKLRGSILATYYESIVPLR